MENEIEKDYHKESLLENKPRNQVLLHNCCYYLFCCCICFSGQKVSLSISLRLILNHIISKIGGNI